jgi:hypothetical protein
MARPRKELNEPIEVQKEAVVEEVKERVISLDNHMQECGCRYSDAQSIKKALNMLVEKYGVPKFEVEIKGVRYFIV